MPNLTRSIFARLFTFLVFLGLATYSIAADRVFLGAAAAPTLSATNDAVINKQLSDLHRKALLTGTVKVIVGTRAAFAPEGKLTALNAEQQRNEFSAVHSAVLQKISSLQQAGKVKRFERVPFMAVEADANELVKLANLPEVTSITEDRVAKFSLAESVPLLGGTNAVVSAYSGSGQTVAIIDTGVDKAHPFLTGKVVSEACFSSNVPSLGGSSVCPSGVTQSTAAGSGINCAGSVAGCDHGTHVAGIIAGKTADVVGVARDANIIAVQVGTRFDNAELCGSRPCALAYFSDLVQALERVYALHNTYAIAAVNLSSGSGKYTNQSSCDADNSNTALKSAIDNLRAVNIPTIVASGNDGFTDGMSAPACLSSAISVGATADVAGQLNICAGNNLGISSANQIACYSNSSSFLNLLAPGSIINSSLPGNAYGNAHGTSLAAAHVTGAWALLKQKKPDLTIAAALNAFTSTGLAVTDARNGVIKPRITIDAALNSIPCAFSLNPSTLTATPGVASGSITVTAASGCTWTINSNANWLKSGSTGTGNGTAIYAIAGNTLATSRTGNLTIGDKTFVVTQAGDTLAPTVPSELIAKTIGPTQISLSWASSSDNVAVTGYRVYRGKVLVGSPTTTNFTDAGLTPSTSYSYRVAACDAANNCSVPSSAVSEVAGATSAMPSNTVSGVAGVISPNSTFTLASTVATSSRTNLALASEGATVSVSSNYNATTFPASSLINNERTGGNYNQALSWVGVQPGSDWVQINFNGAQTIDRVVLYTLQDNYTAPIEPTDTLTFSTYGVTGFSVEAWNGSGWYSVTAPVTGNNLVKRTVTFNPVATDRIRVKINSVASNYSYLTEIEAFAPAIIDTTAPTIPTNLTATIISASKINLSWAASTDNVGVTSYRVYRDGVLVASPVTASYNDTGLSASTNYTYTVAACDAASNCSAQSTAASAKTIAQEAAFSFTIATNANNIYLHEEALNVGWNGTAPVVATVTSGVVVSSISSDIPALIIDGNWPEDVTLINNGNIGGKGGAGGRAGGIALSVMVPVKVQNNGLLAGGGGGGGTGGYGLETFDGSTWASFGGIGGTGASIGVAATAGSPGQTPNAGSGGAGGALGQVGQPGVGGYGSGTVGAAGQSVMGNSKITWLAVGTRLGPITENAVPDTSAPSIPGGLTAVAAGAAQINLSWSASTDNVGVTSYKVYRGGTLIASPSGTTFSDTGLTAGTTYSYTVTACDAALNCSAQSAVASATTIIPDTSAPSIPGGLTAVAAGAAQINLSWSASTDNVGVTSYKVYRGGTLIASPSGTTFSDTGLTAGTTYSYTVTACDAALNCSAQSAVASATTIIPDTSAPSIPGGLTAVAAGAAQINLSWTASTDNVGVTGYKVYRGGTLIASPSGTTYSDTGLTAGTTYSYTVVACDGSANCSAQSASVSATTIIPDTSAPSIPGGLTAVAAGAAQINLSWSASTDNVGVTGYKVYRGGTLIASPSGTTYSDTGLTAGTTYSYTVTACDAATNCSAQSAVASATTIIPDTSAPTIPAGLTAVAGGATQINLSWSASTDNVGVTGYKVYRGGTLIASPSGTTFSDTGLTAGTTYSYTVTACDAALNCSAQSAVASATTIIPDTSAPSIPGGLTAVAAGAAQINLSWSASTDNVGVTSYKVYRGGTLIASPSGTTFSDTGLTAGTTYSYTVTACDAALNCSAQSAVASATTTQASGPATNVALESTGATVTASSTYGPGYPVQTLINNERTGGNYLARPALSWVGTQPGSDWVQINFNGAKTIDRVVLYTLQDNYISPIEPTDTLTFSLYGVTGFSVEAWNGSAWYAVGAPVTGNNLVKRTVTFAPVTTDRIRVKIDSVAQSYSYLTEIEAFAPFIPDTVAPSTPLGLSANGVSTSKVILNWSPATDNMAVTQYKVHRSGIQVGTSTSASYADTGLVANASYSYKVEACDAANNCSAQSASASATTDLSDPVRTNVALESTGATVTASSTYSPEHLVQSLINNERTGSNSRQLLSWIGTQPGSDWVQINFNGAKTIDRVVLYTLQDNYISPIEPTDTLTFSLYGVTGFSVEAWNGSAWYAVGAPVTGNNLVKRTVTFAPVTTDRIRVKIDSVAQSYSYLTEIEAFAP